MSDTWPSIPIRYPIRPGSSLNMHELSLGHTTKGTANTIHGSRSHQTAQHTPTGKWYLQYYPIGTLRPPILPLYRRKTLPKPIHQTVFLMKQNKYASKQASTHSHTKVIKLLIVVVHEAYARFHTFLRPPEVFKEITKRATRNPVMIK